MSEHTTPTRLDLSWSLECCDDAELVQRYRHGDTAAITVLVRRHEARLLAMAQRVLRDRQEAADAEEAADAVQSAWMDALRAVQRDGFEHRAAVGSWLWRIVRNEAIDRLRRAGPPAPVSG